MSKIGVVFIHGLTGGEATWKNSSGSSFGSLLEKSPIGPHIEVHHFSYYTKISSIFDSAIAKRILGRIPVLGRLKTFQGRIQKNQPIEQLAQMLSTEIRLELSHLDRIVLIAHSLGGLVAKDYILNHDHQEDRKVVGFLSIAVPHKGSLSAQILAPLNKNAQELVPLDEYVSRLNNEWMDKKGDLPESRYVIAAHDECVDKESALPGKIPKNKVFTVNHDHVSVCKPEGTSDSVFKCATQLIDHVLKQKSAENSAAEVFDSSMPDYKKEIFVIKMIISDIGAKGIDNAKESFFQAEIVAKHSSIKERHQIFELQRRVVNLYRAIYNAHSETHDRNSVFSEVHQSIIEQDGAALKCGVEYVSYLHKQGLLHQAANQLTDEVIWGKDGDLDKVEALTK